MLSTAISAGPYSGSFIGFSPSGTVGFGAVALSLSGAAFLSVGDFGSGSRRWLRSMPVRPSLLTKVNVTCGTLVSNYLYRGVRRRGGG